MQPIVDAFQAAASDGRAAFMPYLMAGDPDLDTTARLIVAMDRAGADLVELGIPFSDPLADGPTNQLAAERALASGTNLTGVLQMVKEVRKSSQIPILLMGYFNPFLQYGLERLCTEAAEAGADGFIIPDLQPDDAAEIRTFAEARSLATVFLIAPTSTAERLQLVGRESRGFVYAVSLTGVTGTRTELPAALADFLTRARESIKLPLAVGFGISTPEMAKGVAEIADGVIVGSAVVNSIAQAVDAGTDPVAAVGSLVAEMRAACVRS